MAAGLALVGIAAINTNVVNARQPTEFIQVSVLAEDKADYGVAEQVIAIPAVSADIIEDAVLDFQSQSSVRIITYTPLPAKEPRRDREEGSDSVDETRHNNGQGNGNQPENAGQTGNDANQGNNGNGSSNQNNGNNGNGNNGDSGNSNGRPEAKNQDKDKGNGNSNGNGRPENNNKDNGNGNGNGSGNDNGNSNNGHGSANDG
jgi:hypothetical protein